MVHFLRLLMTSTLLAIPRKYAQSLKTGANLVASGEVERQG
jgi:hypothetical protein